MLGSALARASTKATRPHVSSAPMSGMAMLVALVHTIAMIAVGGILAWLVYRYLGLKFLSRSWFNLDATWAVAASSWSALCHLASAFAAYD